MKNIFELFKSYKLANSHVFTQNYSYNAFFILNIVAIPINKMGFEIVMSVNKIGFYILFSTNFIRFTSPAV